MTFLFNIPVNITSEAITVLIAANGLSFLPSSTAK